MKNCLRNYIQNAPTEITWKLILLFLLLHGINSYIIIYYFIPNPVVSQIKIASSGYIRSSQIAFIYSILLYSILLKFWGVSITKPQKILNNNSRLVTILIFLIAIIFLLFLSQCLDTDDKWNPRIGFFIELLLGATFEELFFRFFLLTGLIQLLKKTLGAKSVWISIIITSLIFSLGHLFYHIKSNNVQVAFYILAFLIGIILSWIYIWFNNIALVILLHLIMNLIVLYLPLEKHSILAGNLLWFFITILLAIYGPRIKKIKITGAKHLAD